MTDADYVSIEWRDGQPPRSRLYGDFYFSRDGGLAEARQVFLDGCGLPDAWRGRRRFCVGELGFGTGLNIAALLDLWLREGPPEAHLSIFSLEAHPIGKEDAARALAAWPELAPVAALLVDRWPGAARGFHRLDLPRATLDLAVMEAGDALKAWSGRADAWFLDGFAPARNTEMWRVELIGLIAERSAPGARLATYTVAGQVRRTLTAAGFEVDRRPGFGSKRQRLEARWPWPAAGAAPAPRVAIIGGGIAGASLARAFAALGTTAQAFDDDGAAASTGPAALVAPRLDAGLGPAAALFAQALARAGDLYGVLEGAIVARGALQLAVGPKDERRFAIIAASGLFEPGDLRPLGADETLSLVGEAAPAGLMISTALVVAPARVLGAWLAGAVRRRVAALAQVGDAWRLLDADGGMIAEADIVCVAAGMASAELVPGLPLRAVRGQASFAKGVDAPPATLLLGGYVAAAPGGVMFGATHDRDDQDLEPRAGDHHHNLAALAAVLPSLAARLGEGPLVAHVGVRATTADYLPIAGPAPGGKPGLLVLTGLGSRGFTLAPLLAEHVAALALGAPSPLPVDIARLVDPGRFAARARRRSNASHGDPPPTSQA
jgi:tRNA 5-methylaminomethyl-2-thiouridine biosynthesis bifunctional protein